MKIHASLNEQELAGYTARQICNLFPDGQEVKSENLRPAVSQALARLEHCFSEVENKYFFDGERAVFNHLNGDQYAMWLYFLANELYLQKADLALCNKLFLLNKTLHGCDIFYEVTLPSVFLLVHPLGTVLGRGNYSDYFVAYQRCGIGSNHGIYPTLGRHVTLRPGSSVLGNSNIGNVCQIATDALVIDKNVEDNTLLLGRPGQIRIRPNTAPYPLWRTHATKEA